MGFAIHRTIHIMHRLTSVSSYPLLVYTDNNTINRDQGISNMLYTNPQNEGEYFLRKKLHAHTHTHTHRERERERERHTKTPIHILFRPYILNIYNVLKLEKSHSH